MKKIETIKKPLSYEVAIIIKDYIINNNLKPGDKIQSESELINIIGVSRGTIREAIKILSSKNIVKVDRGNGTYVCKNPGLIEDPLGISFLNDKNILVSLYEFRLINEPECAKIAALRAQENDLISINNCINEVNIDKTDRDKNMQLDLNFHKSIARATRNSIMLRIIPIIHEAIIKTYPKTLNIPGNDEKALNSHMEIFEVIKLRDGEKAKNKMYKHLEETLNDINNIK